MSGININSEAWCRKAYLNYHCYDNSMGLSARDMAKITQQWSDRLASWQNSVSSDENEYDFDDSDYSAYKSQGKAAAKEQAGDIGTGDKALMYTRGVGDAASGIAGALGTTVGSKVASDLGTKVLGSVVEDSVKKATEKATEETTKKSIEKAGQNVGWIITAPLALATGTAYQAKKPNKDEVEAAKEMNNVLANAQGSLAETQGEMETMSEELITLSDEANEMNEATNEEMAEDKTEFDFYMETIKRLD